MKILHWLCAVAAFLLFFVLCPTPARAEELYYIVGEGESWSELCRKLGLDARLLALMNDREGESLSPGMLLRLPQTPCFSLIVAEGDTLDSLAACYGVDAELLAAQNGLCRDALLYAGELLSVPLSEETASCGAMLREELQSQSSAAVQTAFLWPLQGVITSGFGLRERDDHQGLDVAADGGTPITAAAAGTVLEAGWRSDGYGYAVLLDHGDGRQTMYAHASAVAVEAGDRVTAGQTVAYVGSTGISTGSHLHFEVRIDGVCVDPLLYLPQ